MAVKQKYCSAKFSTGNKGSQMNCGQNIILYSELVGESDIVREQFWKGSKVKQNVEIHLYSVITV